MFLHFLPHIGAKLLYIRMGQEHRFLELVYVVLCAHQVITGCVSSYLCDLTESLLVKRRYLSTADRRVAHKFYLLAGHVGNQPDPNRIFYVKVVSKCTGNIQMLDVVKLQIQPLQEDPDRSKYSSLGRNYVFYIRFSNEN